MAAAEAKKKMTTGDREAEGGDEIGGKDGAGEGKEEA
jgi:hypothetical protein